MASDLNPRVLVEEEDDDDNIELEEHDEEEEEEEEEEEIDEGVTLGFVEKPKNPWSLLRHLFPSKAGSVPAWLDPVNLPYESSRTCGFCGEPLQFLLQIYAPISKKESTFHRTLYVFICPSMSCLFKDQHEQWKRNEETPRRSVKVFRCQLPRSNPFYSSEPPRRDGSDKPSSAGAALCSWCGTWRGEKICSRCRRAYYCSEKHQEKHWNSGHKIDCCQMMNSSDPSASILSNGKEELEIIEKVACKSLWPEYEIVIEDECSFDTEVPENSSCTTSPIPCIETDIDKKIWASFQGRIAKAPEQVLRYCREVTAKPLWPLSIGRPSEEDIPKCKYCQGPLCYEFQIMPQLLYYFGMQNEPNSLDWAVIIVYTCLASCEASVSYKEEFAWVQLYPVEKKFSEVLEQFSKAFEEFSGSPIDGQPLIGHK